jgi:hypothetical protein
VRAIAIAIVIATWLACVTAAEIASQLRDA